MSVSNQSETLSSEQLASLFDPFARGVPSRGLGLRLWLARQIALAHQGTLTAHVEAGTSIRFVLDLPVEEIQPQ